MGIIADALKGGGSFLKWPDAPGTTYTGVITDVTLRQARKFESTEPDSWDDGTPKMEVVLTLATDYREAGNPDDTGERAIAIKLWSGQKKALIAACKAAGVDEPLVGQRFTVTHVSGVGTAKAPRVFEYRLEAGPSGVAEALVEQPVTAAAPQPPAAAASNPVEVAKQLLAAGLSTADAAKGSGLPEPTVAALKNTLAA